LFVSAWHGYNRPVHLFRRFFAAVASVLLVGSLAGSGPKAAAAVANVTFDPHTLLVGFSPTTTAFQRTALHRAEGTTLANRFDWLNVDVVRLPPTLAPPVAARAYAANPLVQYAEPNYSFHLLSIPNDTNFGQEYDLHNTGQNGGTPHADIHAPEGWDLAFGPGKFPSSGGVRVGIVDTGIDRNHVDVGAKTKACAESLTATGTLVSGVCADDNMHGTHVAGTIAAFTNNATGVAGVAPNADLAICKALNGGGIGFTTDIVACIKWLRTTGAARIISMSIGSSASTATFNAELSAAYAAGVLLVAAAGNDGNSTINYPAGHKDVMSVAATDNKDAHASFSNCNADVEIAAPGVNILSTIPGNQYATLSGTSMATPHVAGAAAVVMAKKRLTAAQTRSVLTSTATDRGPAGRDACFGYGRLNLQNALK
jgi:thermitase